MAKDYLHQGDIIKLSLDPTLGHEQAGYRPVLVVSNDEFNKMCGGLVSVVPITSKKKDFPLNIDLPENLPIEGQALLSQGRTVDTMARGYSYWCSVPSDFIKQVVKFIKFIY